MNTYYIAGFPVTDELYHHGILGQKWGVRRYQNPDGTLTAEGQKRYNKASNIQRDLNKLDREIAYQKGDLMKISRKATKLEKKHDKYIKKNPNDERGKEKDYVEKMKDYTNQVVTIGSQMDINRKKQEGLQWTALGRGMNISMKNVTRSSVRPGEEFVRSFGSAAMAVSMAYVSPIGFGFGYGGKSTGPVQGTKYKVRQGQMPNGLKENQLVYQGSNNGTVNLGLREKRTT